MSRKLLLTLTESQVEILAMAAAGLANEHMTKRDAGERGPLTGIQFRTLRGLLRTLTAANTTVPERHGERVV